MTTAQTTTDPVQQSTNVADFLRLLHTPGSVFEIRAPQTSERSDGKWATTYSGYFNEPELVANAIKNEIPDLAPAVYVTMNPVQPDLIARADNCIKSKVNATTRDANILKRRWLFFDIDPKRPAGISSTETETSYAMKLAKSLREYLAREGWPEPLRGMSGNGGYLLYRLELPVDDDGLIRSVLESLARRFDSDKAEIDTTVHNASRIVKVLGTIARKGADFRGNREAEARPHRRSWFFPPEQSLAPVSVKQLCEIVSANPITKDASKSLPAPRPRSGFDRFQQTPDGVEGYLVKHGVEVRSRKPVKNGTMLILNRCPVHPDIEDHEGSSIGVLVDDSGKISYDNWHKRAGSLGGTQWVDVREALEPGYKAFSERQRAVHMNPSLPVSISSTHNKPLTTQELAELPLTDKTGTAPTTSHSTENVIERADPIPLAEHFIDRHYRDADGRLLLRRHRADFYSFAGSCYQALTDEEIDAAIYRHLEQCSTVQRDGLGAPKLDELGQPKVRPITPKSAIVREVRLALPSRGVLLDERIDLPYWLTARDDLDPTKIVPCRNGLLDLSTRTLHPLTPDLFSVHALPFDYDPDAPDPVAWLAFLNQLWETDLEAWRALQRWFGYCLCADTRQHKILMIVGPKRSGKGTVARVLAGLLGAVNVAGPPLASLATNFGLQPLMGKLLAIVSDARLSGRTDQAIVVERLLSISGEDLQTIDRKHKAPVTVKLPTRFMLLTNELPRLRDTSGALASRFIILTLTESWYGREDHDLTDKLLDELPGVLNWAIDGWTELQDRGRFTQPQSSADAIRELEDLSSPMGAFLRDCCNVASTCSIECGELFEAWKKWCAEQGRDRPGTKQTFSRDLRAAVPALRTSRPRTDGGRSRLFEGVGLGDTPNNSSETGVVRTGPRTDAMHAYEK